jgi:hypothetical protein
MQPSYVYKITIISTGQYYIGFRKANNVSPEHDLLKLYFSSSNKVKHVISVLGIDAVKGEILFTSKDPETSYWYEQQLISDNLNDPLILNMQCRKYKSGFKMFLTTPESTAKMLATQKKKRTRLTESWIRGQQQGHNKRYQVTSPNGETYEICGLKEHCLRNNLNHSAMSQVGQGKKPHHKGWKCARLP